MNSIRIGRRVSSGCTTAAFVLIMSVVSIISPQLAFAAGAALIVVQRKRKILG